MKKKPWIYLAILFIGLLTACNLSEENQADASFTGTITEVNESTALISIEEGAILDSGDQVTIDLSISDESFEIGDTVRVGYDGGVMESYPLQVNAVFIERFDE